MTTELHLFVYRNLDNRLRNEPDTSPFAFELHERRRRALEDAFPEHDDISVNDWGLAKDSQSHELVEIVVAASAATFKYAILPGLAMLGEKLMDLGADRATSEFVKAVVARLRPKQQARDVNDYAVKLPDGTVVNVLPPDREGTITVRRPDGTVVTIESSKTT